MKKNFWIAAAFAIALLSCAKVSQDAPEMDGDKTVYNIVIDPVTKAELVDGSDADHISLKWKTGDKVAFKFTDGTIQEGSVTLDGSAAKVSVVVPDGESVEDVWFPSNKKTKPTKILEGQEATTINVPLQMTSISGSTITLGDIVDWALVRVSVKKGINGDPKTLKQIKFKNNNGAAATQMVTIGTTTTLSDEAVTFDFVVPAVSSTVELIFVDSDGLEYRRKRPEAIDLVSHKVYRLPVIDDIDNTGKYRWILKGENGPVAEPLSQNAPFTYVFKGNKNEYFQITRGSDYWTETATVSNSKNNFYFAPTFLDSNGKSCVEWGTLAESKTTINGAADQVMRFPVHTGNYPILAFKVTKLDLLGTGMKVRLDVNSTQDNSAAGTNTYVGRYMPVRYTGAAENRHQTLSEDDVEGTGIYYINLAATNVQFKNNTTSVNETLPNSRTLHFTTFNLQFRDIVPGGESPSDMKIYWMGFFNSVSELESFVAAH